MTRNTAKIIVVLMVIIALFSVIFTVFTPTHAGEIRQDLREGDYYILEADNPLSSAPSSEEFRIISIDGNDLKVSVTSNNITSEMTMTRSEFLRNVIFSYGDGYNITGYATLDTGFGSRFCNVYENDSCQYWVGEHDIIYKYSLHGMVWRLTETSLIIK